MKQYYITEDFTFADNPLPGSHYCTPVVMPTGILIGYITYHDECDPNPCWMYEHTQVFAALEDEVNDILTGDLIIDSYPTFESEYSFVRNGEEEPAFGSRYIDATECSLATEEPIGLEEAGYPEYYLLILVGD